MSKSWPPLSRPVRRVRIGAAEAGTQGELVKSASGGVRQVIHYYHSVRPSFRLGDAEAARRGASVGNPPLRHWASYNALQQCRAARNKRVRHPRLMGAFGVKTMETAFIVAAALLVAVVGRAILNSPRARQLPTDTSPATQATTIPRSPNGLKQHPAARPSEADRGGVGADR